MANTMHVLFFPALLAGALCCVTWRHLPDRNAHLWLLLAGAGLFAVPQLIVVIAGAAAAELLVYRQAVLAGWVLAVGVFVGWRLLRTRAGRAAPSIAGRAAPSGRLGSTL